MQVFAIICLIVLLISIQHILNWGLRGIWKEHHDGNLTMSFFFVVIVGAITYFAGKYLILWAYPLIQ